MIAALDLFCGAGGFTLGLHNSGINCVAAVEEDRFAAATFSHNFPEIELHKTNVRELNDSKIRTNFAGIDLLVAGPPCQGFSVAGPSQYGEIDDRNSLLTEVTRFARVLRPKLCVVENVKGLLSGKLNRKTKGLIHFTGEMEDIGYRTSYTVLQAADYGVPQWRERVFIFSVRGAVTHYVEDFLLPKGRRFTVHEAISDLPKIESGEGIEELAPYSKTPKGEYPRLMREGSPGIYNHVSMKHTKRLIKRFRTIPVGGSLVDAPSEHGQRIRNGTKLDVRSRFKMNNQRLNPNKISLAITASFQSNFIHPSCHRNLTAREGARLQSFPDHFRFLGPRTLMSKKLLIREGRYDELGLSQYNQIGNAVPPQLAEAVGSAIQEFMVCESSSRSKAG